MSERAIPVSETERERQREVLGPLFKASGLKLTPAAAKIGVSAGQLSRYLSGDTILPTTNYQNVAAAFGISRDDLATRLLGIGDDDDAAFDFRAALHAAIPESPPWAEDLFREHADAGVAHQRSLLEFLADLRREDCLVVPARFRGGQERPNATERAEPDPVRAVS